MSHHCCRAVLLPHSQASLSNIGNSLLILAHPFKPAIRNWAGQTFVSDRLHHLQVVHRSPTTQPASMETSTSQTGAVPSPRCLTSLQSQWPPGYAVPGSHPQELACRPGGLLYSICLTGIQSQTWTGARHSWQHGSSWGAAGPAGVRKAAWWICARGCLH